jgi:hypothetical protein
MCKNIKLIRLSGILNIATGRNREDPLGFPTGICLRLPGFD